MIDAVRRQRAGWRVGGRSLHRFRCGADEVGRNPYLAGQRFHAADGHGAGGRLVGLELGGAFHDLLDFVLVIPTPRSRSALRQLLHEECRRGGTLIVTDGEPPHQCGFDVASSGGGGRPLRPCGPPKTAPPRPPPPAAPRRGPPPPRLL